jgi:hypothetical protein
MDTQGALSNVETLRAAGLIVGELPDAYYSVFERLSDEELATVLLIKARLDGTRDASNAQDWTAFVPF